ncbi:sigma-S stabilization anti-adapter protein IraP [Sodalis sp. RH21]|uniref:sigma-S stabilization anti-adapter protein IraP n=1 Tax=unclassified Sodalis (in: enterobacteria) TaxID=2636512 RepID=UPI0039B37C4F
MNDLIIQILNKLARTDAKMKDLTALVEAQSLLLAALVLTVGKGSSSVMSVNIQKAISSAKEASEEIMQSDADLLLAHFVRLISVTQFIEANAEVDVEAGDETSARAAIDIIAEAGIETNAVTGGETNTAPAALSPQPAEE